MVEQIRQTVKKQVLCFTKSHCFHLPFNLITAFFDIVMMRKAMLGIKGRAEKLL
jgi:hypothetical protein